MGSFWWDSWAKDVVPYAILLRLFVTGSCTARRIRSCLSTAGIGATALIGQMTSLKYSMVCLRRSMITALMTPYGRRWGE